MSKISFFPGGYFSKKANKYVPAVKPIGEAFFEDYLQKVKEGYYQDEVLHYRAGRIEKLKLPGVTPSGTFVYRSSNSLKKHSGILVIDIDKDDQMPGYDHNVVKLKMSSDPYIYACHLSCSGDGGLAAYVKVDPARHLDAFQALEKYFADEYQLMIDPSGKDISRFRFVSYDPDLILNDKPKIWKKYLTKKKREPRRHNFIFSNDDLDHVFSQISARGIDLTHDYHDWFRIGCAISDHFGPGGLDKFHLVSSQSEKYDSKACDDLYSILLKRGSRGIGIGTFLWLAKMSGIEISSPRTQQIAHIAFSRKKQIGLSGGPKNIKEATQSAKKYLKEMQDIEGDDVDEMIENVMKLPGDPASGDGDDVLPRLKAWLTTKDIKFNKVTGQHEMNGEPLNDRMYNSLYIEALELVDKKITKDLLFSLIISDATKGYHPFEEYFKKVGNRNGEGFIDEFLDCIEVPDKEYRDLFMRKWLLSIVASAHGTYSLMIMVLTGDQRVGKTKFFRSLLPDDLMAYYGESQLDEKKDSEILMTQKLLIVDDEFSGKSKRDYKKLKDLSSKQFFNIRRPYGKFSEDMKRYAVLAGNSNEDEIINDPTGNRRIIPMDVKNIDHDRLEEIDRDDLWGELYREWKKIGDGWMLNRDDIKVLNDKTEGNRQASIEEELIQKHFDSVDESDVNAEYLTATDIKIYIEEKNPTVRIQIWQLGTALKSLGFTKTRKRIHGKANPSNVYIVKKLMPGESNAFEEYDEDIPF